MQTQQDNKVRLVALVNLDAMCQRISGWAHTFTIAKVSRSRVHVEYSNPDEYGNPRPMVAVFPCYPSGWADDAENPRVVLYPLRITGPDAEWEYFYPLESCPELFRQTAESTEWYSREEWDAKRTAEVK